MHPTGGIELAHARIDDGETGAPLAPRHEKALVVLPFQLVIFILETRPGHMREMPENLPVKIAPDQLIDENVRLFPCGGMFPGGLLNCRQYRARRKRAQPQMGREARSGVQGRKVALVRVVEKIRSEE